MLRVVTFAEPIAPQDTQHVTTCTLSIYMYVSYTALRRNMPSGNTGSVQPSPAHARTQLRRLPACTLVYCPQQASRVPSHVIWGSVRFLLLTRWAAYPIYNYTASRLLTLSLVHTHCNHHIHYFHPVYPALLLQSS